MKYKIFTKNQRESQDRRQGQNMHMSDILNSKKHRHAGDL